MYVSHRVRTRSRNENGPVNSAAVAENLPGGRPCQPINVNGSRAADWPVLRRLRAKSDET